LKVIFDENHTDGEKTITFEPLFEGQTSLEFCVLQGQKRGKTWYRLYDEQGLETTEVTFTHSKPDEKLKVSVGSEELTPIKNLNSYLNELWNNEKYWEILGIKEWSDNTLVRKARNVKNQIIFQDEREIHGIISGAYTKLRPILETIGSVDVELDFSSVDVYVDGVFKGKHPCKINLPSGEHTLTLKQGENNLHSETVNVKPKEKKKLSISLLNSLSRQINLLSRQENDQRQRIVALEDKTRKLKNAHRQKINSLEARELRKIHSLEEKMVKLTPSNTTLTLLTFLGIELQLYLLLGLYFLINRLDIAGCTFLFLFLLSSVAAISVFHKRRWGSTLALTIGIITSLMWFIAIMGTLAAFSATGAELTLTYSSILFVCSITLSAVAKKERNRQT